MTGRLSVLWITPHTPTSNSTGGAMRAYELLRGCAKGHDVEVWQTGAGGPDAELKLTDDRWHRYPAREASRRRHKIGVLVDPLPLAAWSSTHELTRRAVDNAASAGHDLIVVDQYSAYGLLGLLRACGLPWIHIEQGIEWRLAASIARRAPTPYGVILNASNAARAWWWGRRTVREADGVVAASEPDAAALRAWGARRVHVAPNGTRIPAAPAHQPRPGQARRLLFLGSLDYWPNVDACEWLTSKLMPAIRREVPDAVLTVIGRKPLPRVMRLHDPASGIEVVGEVDEVRPWLAGSDVLLVPMRAGHGTKIKMIEAAANGLPMVATDQADAGLDYGAAGAALTARDAPAFVAQTVALLRDPELRQRLSTRARSIVAGSDWDEIGARFAAWLPEVAAARGAAGVPVR
ncbi:MAG TPA: glycosyltransferase family 4 protein [Candidatus Dormibacteraeota bacterium]